MCSVRAMCSIILEREPDQVKVNARYALFDNKILRSFFAQIGVELTTTTTIIFSDARPRDQQGERREYRYLGV